MNLVRIASLLCWVGILLGCDGAQRPARKSPPIPPVFASDDKLPDVKSSPLTCRLEFLPVRNGSCVFTPMTADALMSMFPGQEVLPQIWLRNTTDKALKVPFEFDVRLQVVGADGDLMPGIELPLKPILKGERTIAPGHEDRFGFDCEYRHGYLCDRGAKFDLKNPGQYFVRAVATSAPEAHSPSELWTGTVRSSPVAIAIRTIEYGPERNGLQLSLVSYQPNEGGLPLGVVFRNSGSQPLKPSWDANRMLHLTITGRDGKPVRDDFATNCGPSPSITLQPGDVFCHAHDLEWSVMLDTKPGPLTVSLTLDVFTGHTGDESRVLLKSNPLMLSRPKPRR